MQRHRYDPSNAQEYPGITKLAESTRTKVPQFLKYLEATRRTHLIEPSDLLALILYLNLNDGV